MGSGREARLMPIRQRARSASVDVQVCSKPAFLRRSRSAPAYRPAVPVERDQMPRPEVEAVISGAWVSRGSTEVCEVASSAPRVVFVIAGTRVRDRLEPAPQLVVRVVELRERAVMILFVPERQESAIRLRAGKRVGVRFVTAAQPLFEVEAAFGTVASEVAGGDDQRSRREKRRDHFFGLNERAAEFMQKRWPVGFGPSSKTCPRCEPHALQRTSVRTMPRPASSISSTASRLTGSQKLGQPVPESNFVSEPKSVAPHAAHA